MNPLIKTAEKMETQQEYKNRVQSAIQTAYQYNEQEIYYMWHYHGYVPNLKSYTDFL